MSRFFLLPVMLILFSYPSMGQTDIFLEQFDTESDCTNSGFDDTANAYPWSSTCNSITQCNNASAFCGVDAGFGNFEFRNLNNEGDPSSATWTTDPISVDPSVFAEITISVTVLEFSSSLADQCFDVYYSVDAGATMILMGSVCGDFSAQTFMEDMIEVDATTSVVVEVFCENPNPRVMVLDEVRVFSTVLSEEILSLNVDVRDDETILCSWSSNFDPHSELSLQRSRDGLVFRELWNSANTELPLTSTFIDQEPYIGQNFYRLQLQDEEGNLHFSSLVAASIDNSRKWEVSSSMDGSIFIKNLKDFGKPYEISIVSTTGQILYQHKTNSTQQRIRDIGYHGIVFVVLTIDGVTSTYRVFI